MNTGELTVGWRIAQLLPLFTALVALVKFVTGAESRLSTIICWLGVLRRNVVFPAPFAPSSPHIPGVIVRDTSLTAFLSLYIFET